MVEFRLKEEHKKAYLNLFQEGGMPISRTYIPNVMVAFHEAWFENKEETVFSKCDKFILAKREFATLNDNIRDTGGKNYKISVEDMGFLLFYLFTLSSLDKEIISKPDLENRKPKSINLDKKHFSLDDINKVLNVYFDTSEVSENSFLRLKKFIECISKYSKIGMCTLDKIDNVFFVQKLEESEIKALESVREEQESENDEDFVKSNKQEQREEFIKFEPIHSSNKDYPEVRYIDKFFKKNKYSLIRFLRRFLPIQNEKRNFKNFTLNEIFGNSKVIAQMMDYYIPATFNLTGKEDDKAYQEQKKDSYKSNKNKNIVHKNENNLIEELWKKAVIEENTSNFFFVLAGTGRGKTSLIIKLYIKYLRYSHKFKHPKLLLATKFDIYFDEKLEIIIQRCNFYLENSPNVKIILLVDALDEDIMINDAQKMKARLYQLSDRLSYFDSVIITSRKQLFPTEIEVERIRYYMPSSSFYYINPFTEAEIDLYIEKKYSNALPEAQYKSILAKKYVQKYRLFMSSQMLLSFMDFLVAKKYEHHFKSKEELYHYIIQEWIRRETQNVRDKFSLKSYNITLEDYSNKVARKFYEEQVFGASKVSLKDLQENIKEFSIYSRSMLHSTSNGYYFFAHKTFLDYFIANALVNDISFDEIFIPSPLYKEVYDIYYFLAWKKILRPIMNNPDNITFFLKSNINKGLKWIEYESIPDVDYIQYKLSWRQRSSDFSYRDIIRLFKNASSIDLSNQHLLEIPVFKGLDNLKILILDNNPNINLDNISTYINLIELQARNSKIKNIDILKSLSKLEVLDLSNNEVENILPIQSLTNLKSINFQSNKIKQIYGFKGFNILENLIFSQNQISTLPKLDFLPALTNINLSYNKIHSISSLSSIYSVKVINLKENPINEPIAILKNCIKLEKVIFTVFQEAKYIFDDIEEISHVKLIYKFKKRAFIPRHFNFLRKISTVMNSFKFEDILLNKAELQLFFKNGTLDLSNNTRIVLKDLEHIKPVVRNIILSKKINIPNFNRLKKINNYQVKIKLKSHIVLSEEKDGDKKITYQDNISEYKFLAKYIFKHLDIDGIPVDNYNDFMQNFLFLESISINCLPLEISYSLGRNLPYIINENLKILPKEVENHNPYKFIASYSPYVNTRIKTLIINGWLMEFLDIEAINWASYVFKAIHIKNINSIINWNKLLLGKNTTELYFFKINITLGLFKNIQTIKNIKFENCIVDDLSNIFKFKNIEELSLKNVRHSSNSIDFPIISSLEGEIFEQKKQKIELNHKDKISFFSQIQTLELTFIQDDNQIFFEKEIFQNLPYLKKLILSNVDFDSSLLNHIKHDLIEELVLDNVPIRNLSFLKKMKNLKKINLCNLTLDKSEKTYLPKTLEYVTIKNVGTFNIKEIKNLKNLIELTLSGFHINEPLISNSFFLRKINMSRNNIKNLKGFEQLKNLEILNISNNRITDLSPLKRLKKLKELHINENPINSVETIKELVNLSLFILYIDKSKTFNKPNEDNTIERIILKDYPNIPFSCEVIGV